VPGYWHAGLVEEWDSRMEEKRRNDQVGKGDGL